MPLTSGAIIGPYKIDREIGRGGMGVVFLAHDMRLGRAVALKALPEDVASDPDRLQRFEREARVLASLNHPNVAVIYGLEERDGRRYLALENIEGETLSERLAHGPLSLSETLDIGVQIAAGMEAAHDGGVVHRDLKPANVMITPDEMVKILDFGLAKGRVVTDESGLAKSPAMVDSPTHSSPTLTHSPTAISPATIPGVILGTAPYLSPEQARGKIVDRRTDIWSFGCVLFECLTGRKAFEGETVSDTIAMILVGELDWSELPSGTPPRLRELLERCLIKDPKRRLRDIGDARIMLEELRSGRYAAAAPEPAQTISSALLWNRRTALLAGAAVLICAILGVAAWKAGQATRATSQGVAHLSLEMPRDVRIAQGAVSSDGRTIAILGMPAPSAAGENLRSRVYVRQLDQASFQPLRETEGAISFVMSPDGRWIQFRAPAGGRSTQTRIFKIQVDGSSPPTRVCDARADWTNNAVMLQSGDVILATTEGAAYVRLNANGRAPDTPRPFDAKSLKNARFLPVPPVLPGDRGIFLNAIWYENGVYRDGIAVMDLKSNRVKLLVLDGGSPHYSRSGHLLFTRQDALMAVPFRLTSLEVKGEPVAVLGGLRQDRNWTHANFGLASNGMILYAAGGNVSGERGLVIVGRDGTSSEWSGERQAFEYNLNASSDGNRCAVEITNEDAITEIWISERGASNLKRLLVRPGADCANAVWSPDGSRIAYFQWSDEPGDGIYISRVDESAPPQRLAARTSRTSYWRPTSWSPDGSTLLAALQDSGVSSIVAISTSPNQGELTKPRLLLRRSRLGSFSPDGRWIAYASYVSGKMEVYVFAWNGQALTGQPLMVSREGGTGPRWGKEGRRLYYVSRQEKLMGVEINSLPSLGATTPSEAWDLGALRIPAEQRPGPLYDTLPGGRLLGIRRGPGEDVPTHVEAVLNFSEEVERRLHAARR